MTCTNTTYVTIKSTHPYDSVTKIKGGPNHKTITGYRKRGNPFNLNRGGITFYLNKIRRKKTRESF